MSCWKSGLEQCWLCQSSGDNWLLTMLSCLSHEPGFSGYLLGFHQYLLSSLHLCFLKILLHHLLHLVSEVLPIITNVLFCLLLIVLLGLFPFPDSSLLSYNSHRLYPSHLDIRHTVLQSVLQAFYISVDTIIYLQHLCCCSYKCH